MKIPLNITTNFWEFLKVSKHCFEAVDRPIKLLIKLIYSRKPRRKHNLVPSISLLKPKCRVLPTLRGTWGYEQKSFFHKLKRTKLPFQWVSNLKINRTDRVTSGQSKNFQKKTPKCTVLSLALLEASEVWTKSYKLEICKKNYGTEIQLVWIYPLDCHFPPSFQTFFVLKIPFLIQRLKFAEFFRSLISWQISIKLITEQHTNASVII